LLPDISPKHYQATYRLISETVKISYREKRFIDRQWLTLKQNTDFITHNGFIAAVLQYLMQ